MTQNEERSAPGRDSSFVVKSQLLSTEDVSRALTRMAHEIVERNRDLSTVSVRRLVTLLGGVAADALPIGLLDVSFYRDDLSLNPMPRSSRTEIDHDLTDRTVVLVDDVLFTGRTIRAALNALTDWGRPRSVQLVVMVDRGHRELPIRPDYVGKNLPTSLGEDIKATLEGVWIGTRP
jgi:pyrimidine operon attenuation protein/uracil phosphoribosyltransferase